MSEMDIRPEDLDDELDRVETADLDIEVPEEDAVEQRMPAQPIRTVREHRDRVPLEVDPADAAEQNRVVELDDDDYR